MPCVLFVDDEVQFQSSLRRMLKVQPPPWQYQFVLSGAEAQNLANQGNIDVVIADLKMPGIDGLQLLKSLKKKPETKHIPVVMLTGRGDEESAVQAMRLGATDYLMKDAFTRESLERSILAALEKQELQRQAEKYRRQLEQKVIELENTLARVRSLEGLLPICMFCKKIRTNENRWQMLELYIEEHSVASFSHTMCDVCAEEQRQNLRKSK